jgi:sorbitol-6-phosphate 2-dehydrogenase
MSGVLDEKVAIVTGAAQGLGRAIAERLAREGAEVFVADINSEGAARAAGEISAVTGVLAREVHVDVTDEDSVRAMADTVVAARGRLDIMIANAGILISGEVMEFDGADWRRVIDVDLVGYFLCAKHAARVMTETGGGVIVQINSKSGKRGSYRNSAYAAAKFGGIGLTQSLALELADHKIRVNAVCPGNLLDSPLWVDSLYEQYARRWNMTPEEVRRKYEEQVPLGRGCTYDDVCNVVVFLCSDQSSYMTGQAINVTGGQEMR